MTKSILFLLICSFLVSCSSVDKEPNRTLLFDQYNTLIQQLKANDVKLVKYVSSGVKRDTITIDSVNWNNELKLFFESDILKNKLIHYKTKTSKEGCKVMLQTDSFNEAVKKLEYSTCGNSLYVNMLVNKKRKIYNFDYHLELTPDGFLIETDQQIIGGQDSKYRIEGKFRQ